MTSWQEAKSQTTVSEYFIHIRCCVCRIEKVLWFRPSDRLWVVDTVKTLTDKCSHGGLIINNNSRVIPNKTNVTVERDC